MNRTFIALTLSLSLSAVAMAGVKVTNLDLKTNGPYGYVNVFLSGRSPELPDLKVSGKTIEITLSQAETFSEIAKRVQGADLAATIVNGKAVIKATLPYEISAQGVDLGWKNNNIEVIFPRGRAKETTAAPAVKTEPTHAPVMTPAPAVEKRAEIKINKELLNEDYLDKLVKETNTPVAAPQPAKDEVKVKQSALAKAAAPIATNTPAPKADQFSFAGYATKFTVFLALVLGLFYGVVQLLKKGVFNKGKLGFLNNSQMIQVLSTTYVSPKRSLMIVKAHKQIFLVANSENGLEFLSEMKDTTGLIKEGEKLVTGENFDSNLAEAAATPEVAPRIKLKENIEESTPVNDDKGLARIAVAKDIVKFSDELKKKAKKLKPIEFN